MTTGTEFLNSLKAKGWTVTEQAQNWKCVSPDGKTFLYRAVQAVKFGTWFDVEKANDVPLP
jgi:hypothetical protein